MVKIRPGISNEWEDFVKTSTLKQVKTMLTDNSGEYIKHLFSISLYCVNKLRKQYNAPGKNGCPIGKRGVDNTEIIPFLGTMTDEAVGNRFGLTRSRIHQIRKKLNVLPYTIKGLR